MLIFVISFLVGVSQLLWLPYLNLIWLLVSLPVFFIATIVHYKTNKNLLILIGISFGFSYAIATGYYAKSQQLDFIPADTITVIGKVTSLPIISQMGSRGDKVKFAFTVSQADQIQSKKILVSWYNSEEIVAPGQDWEFQLKLKPIHGYKNPGSFDYGKWLFRQGFDATATVKKAVLLRTTTNDIGSKINVLRATIADLINDNFQSPRVQSLVRALTIGDKSQISYQDSQLFQDTGTAHLIAISGLHIGLIAFIGILCGRLLFILFANEKFNRFKFEAIFAIGFACFYALLAGLSIPTIRAFIMVTVFSVAYAYKLNISRWQAWSIAMLIVLLIDAFSVLDAGFWFSFGAVAVLMFAFMGRKSGKYKIMTFIKAQVAILIGLMPLMVIVFQHINLLTPFANLLVLPLASLLLIPLIFISMFVYLLSANIAGFLFFIVEQLAQYFFNILDYLQTYNFLSINITNITPLTISVLIFSMVLLLLPRLFRFKYLVLILLLPLFANKKSNLKQHEFQVNMLDVGQGLSVIITTKNHTMIYDTGAKYESGFSLASAVVLPYLQFQGITTVDKLVLSHADNDHAGGVAEITAYYPQLTVLDVTGKYSACKFPLTWQWDEVTFKIYSPFELLPYLGNNSSCVIKIFSKNGSILLTGDIGEPVEYRLIKSFPSQINSDVLLVPHHGSRTSSSENFIQQVNPKIAINSAGFANQFNHPHPLIRQLYLDSDIEFYDTQYQGMIQLNFNSDKINVQQYAKINPHFWHVNVK